ncbi:MAG: hypothetical protein AUK31_01155 [Fibrobacteres bacterium CG2_30_45_31]|nr:MAG: hypothetical protein AUK31_01155 [Fibrobacteres bacterium CG2_30_45_31]
MIPVSFSRKKNEDWISFVLDSLHDFADWHEKGHKRFSHCLIDENMLDTAIELTMDVCESDFAWL